jgi:hypothetical protein
VKDKQKKIYYSRKTNHNIVRKEKYLQKYRSNAAYAKQVVLQAPRLANHQKKAKALSQEASSQRS